MAEAPSHETLYDDVQSLLATARERMSTLELAEEVKAAARRRLDHLEQAARYDLSVASREVAAFIADLDAGVVSIYD